MEQLVSACAQARQSSVPFMIIAKTDKGKHTTVSNLLNWHGKPLDADNLKKTLEILEAQVDNSIENKHRVFTPQTIRPIGPHVNLTISDS